MGGGGAIRAAAKVASFCVNGSLRGAPMVPVAEQSMATASPKASRPATSIVSSGATDEGRSSVMLSSQNGKIDASVQKPLWDIDDWQFAGHEEDLLVDSTNPMPRVVFGGVPTLEEAKEATCELKDALEQVYFTSNSSGGSETKACVTTETAVANPPVPKHALQAFVLLIESSPAQSIVASLVSDKSVWTAVMQNEKVKEFIRSQQTTGILDHDMDLKDKESCADNEFDDGESLKNIDDGRSSGSFQSRFRGFVENVKVKVTEMVKNINVKGKVENVKVKVTEMVKNMSDILQSIFGGSVEGNAAVDEKDSASGIPMEKAIGGTFLGLAVMTIMVVLLKRG